MNWKKPLEALTSEGHRAPARVLGAVSWRGESQIAIAISCDDGEEVYNVRQNGEFVQQCSWSRVENVPQQFSGYIPVCKAGPNGPQIGPFFKTEEDATQWATGHWSAGKFLKAIPVQWTEE